MRRPSKVMLVDGYNVIRSTTMYADLAGEDWTGGPGLNAAREALIADVATAAQNEYDATVVFDGGGNAMSEGGVMHTAGIKVVFSPSGQTADSTIEILAQKAQERGLEVVVVTSDAATQWTVMGENVSRMSSHGFAREMEGVNASWQEHNPAPVVKNTVAERIDPATLQKLQALMRNRT